MWVEKLKTLVCVRQTLGMEEPWYGARTFEGVHPQLKGELEQENKGCFNLMDLSGKN